ncbi:MAG: DUF6328 family protein [Actinomycetota bacterium]|nr:DUF6328 family protein [Actinomycetota bacterium]
MALPGVEVLFAFLLTLPFTTRFETLTTTQRSAYYMSLLSSAVASLFLIAPSARHRMDRDADPGQFIQAASRLAVAGVVLVAVAMSGVVYLVTSVIYGVELAAVVAAALAGGFGWIWFAAPARRRSRRRGP